MLQSFNPRNKDLIVNINGRLVHRDEAGISPFDSLVQGGDGVWEGLRVYQGTIFKLTEHLDRLRDSAKAMAFTEIPPHEDIIHEIRRTLEANGMNDGVHIRLTLSRGTKVTSGMDPRLNQFGPTLIVVAEHKAPVYPTDGLTIISSSVRRFPPDCMDPRIHHNNLIQSIMAKIEANAAGADAALMLDLNGFIAEINDTHFFVVHRGEVFTSPAYACPEGITRSTVLELCAAHGITVAERPLTQVDAYRADELFCTGTMGELAGITRLDGRTIGDGMVGNLTSRLATIYREHARTNGFPILS